MNTLIAFIAVVASFSIAVERIIGLVSKYWSAIKAPEGDETQASGAHLIASFGLGTLIAWLCKTEVAGVVPFASQLDWAVYPVMGLLSSGGSSFWTELLAILKATRIEKFRAFRAPAAPDAVKIASAGPVLVCRGELAQAGIGVKK